ncbi:protein phosphatase Slingshot homolog 1 isoform X2 [Pyxicephalus adspersus]|uniref:protein phosphatase Slingshot homolog 1 isoform X2 n=1 Tax=Pyxicephalus adspersus TaxID=30357 RepID=UPI003B591D00
MALVTLQRSPTPSAASSEFGNDDDRKTNLSLSDSFFMVKGAALFLQQGNSYQGQRSLLHLHKNAGDLPQHLQVMINLLRSEDRIKLAVRLESSWSDRVRYMVVVYSNGRQDTEENILLGVDFISKESKSCTIGMVLHLWSDTTIRLDGDGGFSVNTAGRTHVFKPVSVQAMWSALQVLHKSCEVARRFNYFPGGLALVWASYYESCICSDQSCINEWNTMQDLESARPDSPILFMEKPSEGERTEWVIKATLRSVMMSTDLENVTCKEIRNELEQKLSYNLKEYKEYIDNEMLLILGQMDKASLIFDYLYLGSEWNASNLEELNKAGIGYILNVTREIDNFFPGLFAYHNIRVYDEESTDLLSHWNDAYNFINKAKKNNSKCLVHCKMGVSRSASTVIAYAMKEYGWSMENAYSYVKQRRNVTRPNAGFMRQLLEYEGILDASKQRHNKLWRQQVGQTDLDVMFPTTFQPNNLETDLEYRLSDDAVDPVLSEKSCFRHLSDTNKLIESPNVVLEVEELEKDALLEESPFPEPYCINKAKEKSDFDSSTWEVKKKLTFGGTLTPHNLNDDLKLTEYESKKSVGALEYNKGELRANKDFFISSKRSCPTDSEEDDIFGILSKVKPRYPSCTDCMYPSTAMTSDAYEEPQQLESANTPAVCSQPALLQHMTSAVLNRMHGRTFSKETQMQTDSEDFLTCSSKTDNFNNSVEFNNAFGQVGSYENLSSKRDAKHAKDLKYLFFSKELEKPAMHSYLMQHQESIIQLQKAGLVRKHTKQLERLRSESSSVIKEGPLDKANSSGCKDGDGPSESGKLNKEPKHSFEKLEVVDVSEEGFIKTSTPSFCKMDLMSSYTKDFLKTICYTPTSSSMSSNLTRSSSSDSIHSVRGKPGLVKQRTQEIETRMRLAGLTLSSPLKRSHSLAKLGSLNFSCDDLSCDADFPKIDCKGSSFKDRIVCTDTTSSSGTTETTSGHMESTNSTMITTNKT